MRRILFVAAVALSGIASAVISAPASAEQVCAYSLGNFSNNQEIQLYFTYTYRSEWSAGLDFIARRYNSSYDETLHHYQDVSVFGQNYYYENSIDVWRMTSIQRGGYTSTYYDEYQETLGNCY